jgi:hypothetical protein
MVARIQEYVGLVQPEVRLGDFSTATGWTALSNDTTGIATDLSHILGATSIEFDKVNGTDNKTYAGVSRTLSPQVSIPHVLAHDALEYAVYCSDITNVNYAFVRIGTDGSNYNEWRVADTDITAGAWTLVRQSLADTQVTVTGNGWAPGALAYLCIGVVFDLETHELADVRFDHVAIVTGQLFRRRTIRGGRVTPLNLPLVIVLPAVDVIISPSAGVLSVVLATQPTTVTKGVSSTSAASISVVLAIQAATVSKTIGRAVSVLSVNLLAVGPTVTKGASSTSAGVLSVNLILNGVTTTLS